MGFFDREKEARDQVFDQDGQVKNEASFGHEALSGAAAFFAMHEFEKKQREKGETVSHGFAKEALAGLAGAAVDRLVETKGEDLYDREKAKHDAKKRAEQIYDEQYGNQENHGPHNQGDLGRYE